MEPKIKKAISLMIIFYKKLLISRENTLVIFRWL